MAVFLTGFVFECVADEQKSAWNRRNAFGASDVRRPPAAFGCALCCPPVEAHTARLFTVCPCAACLT